MKFTIGLDKSDIAVISGGVSGPQKVDGLQNFPDSVFDCAAIDVIGVHGYFSKHDSATAGTPWANMFVPGNTLTARAIGKEGKGKLLLVEEWAYVDSKFGLFYKKEAIFDQGNALNLRGIPWVSAVPRTRRRLNCTDIVHSFTLISRLWMKGEQRASTSFAKIIPRGLL